MPRKAKPQRVERGLYRAEKTYLACATPPGSRKVRWRTLGEVHLSEARRLRDQFAAEVHRGEVPELLRRATVGELAKAWLEHQRSLVAIGELGQRTYDGYESAVRLHIVPDLGARQVGSIDSDDLVAWQRAQKAKGATAWSIRARWTPLRLMLGHAARHRLIAANPADRLTRRERPKPGESRQRYLRREEMQALLENAAPPYRAAIATALFSGMRVNELLGLAWRDVEFAGDQILVRFQADRKGRRRQLKTEAGRREVILMPELARLLRAHRLASPFSRDGGPVFASEVGTPLGVRNLSQRGLETACERASLEGVTFHVLRHTFASVLIAQGRDAAFVARQLGHTDAGFTWRTYIHLFDAVKQARTARDELNAEYGSLLRDAKQT